MSIGKNTEFKVHTDDWRLYVERLEQYFLVNKISSELQVPTLITLMGAECYELLVTLCTPVKPKDKKFAQITDVMAKHLQPKPSELAERYIFRHRKQKEGESIAEYVAVLKKISKTCEFGSWLEESLRDQLVCGISNETIKQRLFAKSGLDFGKAYTLAISMEAAEKDAAAVERLEGSRKCVSETAAVACQKMAATTVNQRRGLPAAGSARDNYKAAREAPPQSTRWHGSRVSVSAASSQRGERAQQQCQVCGARHDNSVCD